MVVKKITGTRSYIIVEFDYRKLKIIGELTLTPAFYASKKSILNWEHPFEEIAIGEDEREQIIELIVKYSNTDFKIYFDD